MTRGRSATTCQDAGARRSSSCGRRPVAARRGRKRAFAGGLLALLALPLVAKAAPYLPSDDAQIVERLPTAGSKSARELRRLHAELAQSPQNLALALHVASRDIDAARAESDPRYNGYAEAALSPWINLPAPPPPVLVMRATLRQSRHDFAAALGDLDRVIAVDAGNAQAWLTRAVVLQVEGDYPKALDNCSALRRLTDPFVIEICSASVRVLDGDAAEGYAALQQALERVRPGTSPALRLWALTILAETAARLGDNGAAEGYFRQALSLGIGDGYLLGAFADFLLDEHRPDEVRSLLADKLRVDPLLLRLAMAEESVDAPALAQHQSDLAERFAVARQRGDAVHLREEARFTLYLRREPRAALGLALANWAVQREPWDARLVLEAALAAREPEAARPVLQWLAVSKLEDVHLRPLVARLEGVPR
jgi:Tfp pilus assembly protein PilF